MLKIDINFYGGITSIKVPPTTSVNYIKKYFDALGIGKFSDGKENISLYFKGKRIYCKQRLGDIGTSLTENNVIYAIFPSTPLLENISTKKQALSKYKEYKKTNYKNIEMIHIE